MMTIKGKEFRMNKANFALEMLNDGISTKNEKKMNKAFELINGDVNFSWIDLDDVYAEWTEAEAKANDVMNLKYEF